MLLEQHAPRLGALVAGDDPAPLEHVDEAARARVADTQAALEQRDGCRLRLDDHLDRAVEQRILVRVEVVVVVAVLRGCGLRRLEKRLVELLAPRRLSAPEPSRITRESVWLDTANAIRLGTFALIIPVMTSTDGRWVARTRWIPTARDFCASRMIASSTACGETIIRSASSSITTNRYGSGSSPRALNVRFASGRFRARMSDSRS